MKADPDDRFFGSKPGSANKALMGLVKQYGFKKGHEVFFKIRAERRKAKKTYRRVADRG